MDGHYGENTRNATNKPQFHQTSSQDQPTKTKNMKVNDNYLLIKILIIKE
jgi:hypothetical protein